MLTHPPCHVHVPARTRVTHNRRAIVTKTCQKFPRDDRDVHTLAIQQTMRSTMLAAHHCPVTRAGLLLTALSCIAITFESIIMVAAVSSNQTSSACLTKECSRSEKSEKQSAHRALTSRGCCLCLCEGLAASSAPSSISTCGARRYRWRCYTPSCTHHVSSASLSLEATALQHFTDDSQMPMPSCNV